MAEKLAGIAGRGLDALASEGGHILVAFALLGIGLAAAALQLPKAEDIIIAGLTAVGLVLRLGQPKP